MTNQTKEHTIKRKKIATYKDVIDLLNFIEAEAPVNKWRLRTHHIWPMVKIQISFALLSDLRNTPPLKQEKTHFNSSNQPKRTFFSFLSNNAKDILSIVKLFFKTRKYSHVFAGALSHRESVQGVHFNKFYQSIIEDLEVVNQRALQIEYSPKESYNDTHLPNRKDVIFIDDYLRAFNKIHLFYYKNWLIKDSDFPGQEYLADNLRGNYELPSAVYNILGKSAVGFSDNSYFPIYLFFNFIAKTVKPQIGFGLCYYDINMLAMFEAFNQNKVKTIEIQHGPQSPFHPAYAKQINAPSTGYKMQPGLFWVWDNNSALDLSKGICSKAKERILQFGNPWHQYWIRNEINHNGDYQFSDNIVLVCLSPFQSYLEDFVIEAIKQTHQKYNWWIRIHPRQNEIKDEILDFFNENGILNLINHKDATEYPLPLILSHSKLHITKVSGTTIEAAAFNVPTILTHELGKEYYQEQIMQKKAIYIEHPNTKVLVNEIARFINTKSPEKDKNIIDYSKILSSF